MSWKAAWRKPLAASYGFRRLPTRSTAWTPAPAPCRLGEHMNVHVALALVAVLEPPTPRGLDRFVGGKDSLPG